MADQIRAHHWKARDAEINNSAPKWRIALAIIHERHHGINWLIGYGRLDWDDVTRYRKVLIAPPTAPKSGFTRLFVQGRTTEKWTLIAQMGRYVAPLSPKRSTQLQTMAEGEFLLRRRGFGGRPPH